MNIERLSKLNLGSFTVEDAAATMGWCKWFTRIMLNTAVQRGEFTLRDGKYSLNTAEGQCQIPPPGWWCSRGKGHDGPCAARQQAVEVEVESLCPECGSWSTALVCSVCHSDNTHKAMKFRNRPEAPCS